MKLPVGILKDIGTNRFHPIVFRPAPMASGSDEKSGAMRCRSLGHHTIGFETLELARDWIKEEEHRADAAVIWDWNGKDTPAMVEWFPILLIEPNPEPVAA